MPITVYTCITGLYDRLIPQPVEDGTRYVCFTDRPDVLQGPGWEVRPLLDHVPAPLTDPWLVARYHKVMCYDVFADTPTSVYIDGSALLLVPPSRIVVAFEAVGGVIAAERHSRRTTAASELDACIAVGKIRGDQIDQARRMLEQHKDAGFRDDTGLTNASFLVRNTTSEALRRAMKRWWQMISIGARRDQLSLHYSLWCEGVPIRHFETHGSGARLTTRLRHGTTRLPLGRQLHRAFSAVQARKVIIASD